MVLKLRKVTELEKPRKSSKAKTFIGFLIVGILFLGFLVASFIFVKGLVEEIKLYKNYKVFCQDKLICKCSGGSCDFSTRWESSAGRPEELRQLCEFAEELGDEGLVFNMCGVG